MRWLGFHRASARAFCPGLITVIFALLASLVAPLPAMLPCEALIGNGARSACYPSLTTILFQFCASSFLRVLDLLIALPSWRCCSSFARPAGRDQPSCLMPRCSVWALPLGNQAWHAVGRGKCSNSRIEGIDVLKVMFFLPWSPARITILSQRRPQILVLLMQLNCFKYNYSLNMWYF